MEWNGGLSKADREVRGRWPGPEWRQRRLGPGGLGDAWAGTPMHLDRGARPAMDHRSDLRNGKDFARIPIVRHVAGMSGAEKLWRRLGGSGAHSRGRVQGRRGVIARGASTGSECGKSLKIRWCFYGTGPSKDSSDQDAHSNI